jgi:prepilin-type N-terminal cleavage/methylation domain-containing protein
MNHSKDSSSGFTLIELLIVLAIIAILALVVIFALNPVELFKRARDSNRLSDTATLNEAAALFSGDVNGGFMGSASTTYISVPDPAATSTAGDQCQGLGLPGLPSGWTYHCAPPSNYRNVDGTGWVPINFKSFSSGSPIGSLPVDPTNTTSTNLYYTYTTNGSQYELTGLMESSKYKATFQTSPPIMNFPGVYALGTSLKLSALWSSSGLIAYWPFDEGGGSSTADVTGGHTGALNGGSSWVGGKAGTGALSFNGSTGYVAATVSNSNLGSQFTFSQWVNAAAFTSDGGVIGNFSDGGDGGIKFIVASNGTYITGSRTSPGTIHTCQTNTVTNTRTWYYLVVTDDGTATIRIYVNGVLDTTCGTDPTITNNSNFKIGLNNDEGAYYNGSIDDVRIYDHALSAAEIIAIYNAMK